MVCEVFPIRKNLIRNIVTDPNAIRAEKLETKIYVAKSGFV